MLAVVVAAHIQLGEDLVVLAEVVLAEVLEVMLLTLLEVVEVVANPILQAETVVPES
jgi:hypothetical protein